MENNEEYILTIIIEFLKFKSQFHGLNKENENALKNEF